MNRMLIKLACIVAILAFTVPASAAIVLDLTANSAASGTINGAIYVNGLAGSGTGAFPAFVKLQQDGGGTTERGFNTTANTVTPEAMNNGSADPNNHQLNLGDIPLVTAVNGVQYRVFALDSHEAGGNAGDEFISLDDVQIFVGGTANNDEATFDANGVLTAPSGSTDSYGSLIYRMDGPTTDPNTWVALIDQFSAGSGTSDNFLYVLNSLFGGSATTTPGDGPNVIFYSIFGLQGVLSGGANNPGGVPNGNYGTTATPEEWATGFAPSPPPPDETPLPIPEPASLAIWALGLGLVGVVTRRRMRN